MADYSKGFFPGWLPSMAPHNLWTPRRKACTQSQADETKYGGYFVEKSFSLPYSNSTYCGCCCCTHTIVVIGGDVVLVDGGSYLAPGLSGEPWTSTPLGTPVPINHAHHGHSHHGHSH